MTTTFFDRRAFMKGAGVLFSTALFGKAAEAFERSEGLFATTCKNADGSYSAYLFDETMQLARKIPLPDRGHDVTFHPITGESVVFARRPGNFAIAFDRAQSVAPTTIIAPEGRHFYGHGVFSADGKLLYATENDFENAEGKLGIYDATNRYRRIGELQSHGIGPHDIMLSPNGNTLIVANGGIETHPDYGRTKLNLATMEPNISYIDRQTGALIEQHALPQALHQLSIRHMAIDQKGRIVFGCQYEGAKSDTPPLVGRSALGEGIVAWDCLKGTKCQSANYIGSVAISRDGDMAAVSAPRDNAIAVLSVRDGTILRQDDLVGGCGIAPDKTGFLVSSDQGYLGHLQKGGLGAHYDVAFDNHIGAFSS